MIFRETYQTCTKLFVGMARTKKSHGRTDQQQPPSPPPPSEATPSQARSRKSKDVPRTSSRHPEYTQRLEHNRTRSMVVERGIDFQELAGTSFVIEVQRRKWETYCSVQTRTPLIPPPPPIDSMICIFFPLFILCIYLIYV